MDKVLVTGASSYIGLHCISELLSKGFKVIGSLRDNSKRANIFSALEPFLKNNSHLNFVELDLLKDDGWEEAARDCRYVLHVASPFPLKEPNDENKLIIPAKDGTLRALKASLIAGVERVVITSSMAAISYGHEDNKVSTLNHDDWTNIESKNITAYVKSKTIAERAAWSFVRENEIEMSVINPGFVLGPLLDNNLEATSANFMKKIIKREIPLIPNIFMNCVDVRDVAKLHVAAMLSPQANKLRFPCMTASPMSLKEITEIIISNGVSAPTVRAPDWLIKFLGIFNSDMRAISHYLNKKSFIDSSQTKDVLDWSPTPIQETIVDMVRDISLKID